MKKNPKTVKARRMLNKEERTRKSKDGRKLGIDPWQGAAWKKQKEAIAKRVRKQQAAAHKRAVARKKSKQKS